MSGTTHREFYKKKIKRIAVPDSRRCCVVSLSSSRCVIIVIVALCRCRPLCIVSPLLHRVVVVALLSLSLSHLVGAHVAISTTVSNRCYCALTYHVLLLQLGIDV
jgi:hypothetical protein